MCGSGSTKLLNTDPIRIRIHNTASGWSDCFCVKRSLNSSCPHISLCYPILLSHIISAYQQQLFCRVKWFLHFFAIFEIWDIAAYVLIRYIFYGLFSSFLALTKFLKDISPNTVVFKHFFADFRITVKFSEALRQN